MPTRASRQPRTVNLRHRLGQGFFKVTQDVGPDAAVGAQDDAHLAQALGFRGEKGVHLLVDAHEKVHP